jgi:cation diffusion facilitator family transporter
MTKVSSRYWASYQVLLVTLWFTLLVLAVKAWASLATRSLGLLAESLHTLLDCFSIIFSLMATTTARMAERDIQTHGKLETLFVLFLAAFLGLVGVSLLGLSLYQLESSLRNAPLLAPTEISTSLILLLGVTIAIHTCLALFERYEARVLGNFSLRLSANQILQDLWLSGLVLASLVGITQGYSWLDPAMAVVLVIMLVPSVWNLLNQQLPSLVQQVAIAPDVLTQIACQIEGVAQCTRVRSQGTVGRQVFVQMHLALHPEFLPIAPIVIERLENILRERYGTVQARIYIKGSTKDTTKRKSGQSQRRINLLKFKRS